MTTQTHKIKILKNLIVVEVLLVDVTYVTNP